MAFSVRYLNRDEDSPVRRLQPADRVDGERRSTSYRRYLSASLLPAVAGLIERMFRQIGEAKPEFLAIRRRSFGGNPREWRTHGKFFSSFRNPTRSIYILDILIFLADWNVHIDSPFPKIVASITGYI